jgi:effector-binding domain-containing protein
MAIETPKYSVIAADKKFELRKYFPYITSNVDLNSTDHASAGSSGFSYLAGYIFGNNVKNQKIAMTAPVMTTKTNKDKFRVSFVIPSSFSMKTLPTPNQKEIDFKEISGMTAGVISFSGYTSEKKINKKIEELTKWMSDNGHTPVSEPIIARYNPPWTPGLFRKNEILIPYKT